MKPKLREGVTPPEDGVASAGKEIRSLSNLIRRFMTLKLNKSFVESATGSNAWILLYLSCHSDVCQRDLEKEFCITRSTASKVVILMEKKGFIRRESVLGDARLKKLLLTEKGEQIVTLMKDDKNVVEQTLVKGFTEEELIQFCNYIERMKNNIQGELTK
ncbi:MAG: winged helix-turn-helix transcriptional regulator [Clostridia bacterium]|nr:winged helix-turn-helix transcriptional regulator [Clostridia bacterium]